MYVCVLLSAMASTWKASTKFCLLQILFPSGELVLLSELLVLVFLFRELKRSPMYRKTRNKVKTSGARRNTSSHVQSFTLSHSKYICIYYIYLFTVNTDEITKLTGIAASLGEEFVSEMNMWYGAKELASRWNSFLCFGQTILAQTTLKFLSALIITTLWKLIFKPTVKPDKKTMNLWRGLTGFL